MQHVDDLAVAGHGAAGREGDGKPGRDEDQDDERDRRRRRWCWPWSRAATARGRGRRAWRPAPAARRLPQGSSKSGLAAWLELEDDEARHRQVAEVEARCRARARAGARPPALVNGPRLGDARRPRGRARPRAPHRPRWSRCGDRADLDRHLAGDGGSPLRRAGADEFGRAGAERGEEGQDGDDGRRAPGSPAESTGTSGALRPSAAGSGARRRALAARRFRGAPRCVLRRASLVDVQAAVAEHEAAGVELVHEAEVVGRDDDRGAEPVELDEQPQQPARQRAGRRCRSARRRAAGRAGRSARGRSRRAASRRPRGPAAAHACARRGRPSAAARPPRPR